MKQIIALFLSLLMVGSQVGFAVSTHFCGGDVFARAVSLVGAEVDCGMEVSQESSCSMVTNSGLSISEKSCCDDENHIYQLKEDFNKKQNSVDFETAFVSLFLANYSLLFNSTEKVVTSYIPPSPLLIKDSQVLFQSFLI
tara:strand:- start:920 stop:1339 length:420 start_codon:yes stop_codon:yes gene_type:complete